MKPNCDQPEHVLGVAPLADLSASQLEAVQATPLFLSKCDAKKNRIRAFALGWCVRFSQLDASSRQCR